MLVIRYDTLINRQMKTSADELRRVRKEREQFAARAEDDPDDDETNPNDEAESDENSSAMPADRREHAPHPAMTAPNGRTEGATPPSGASGG
jgi:hypothetical protein